MINSVNRQEVTREPRTEDSQLGRKPDSMQGSQEQHEQRIQARQDNN